jgi:hypothetical protein
VEVAGDAGIWTVGRSSDAVERLLKEEGRGDALSKGEGLVAQFGFGEEENGFVDEVLSEELAVEMSATFEEEAEDVAFGQGGEDRGKAEASEVIGDGFNLRAAFCESGDFGGRNFFVAEDE